MLERLRDWMEAEGAAAAVLTAPVSIAYLTGFFTEPHERLLALVVTGSGATLVVPGLEEESAAAAARDAEVRAWRDGEDGWAVLAAALGPVRGALAIEKGHLTVGAAERLQEVAGPVPLVDAGPRLRELRARKAPWELELLAEAARITDRVTEQVLSGLEAGRTEVEVASEIGIEVARLGARPSFDTLVQSGPNAALPHLRPTSRRLRAGEPLLLDLGAAWQGYKADITRTVAIGEPGPEMLQVHFAVLAAHDAALAAIRPGVTAGEVDEAARAVIREAGLGELFVHRVGHGLGLEAHEDPSLDPGSSTVLEAGMVVTVEPGVYRPGWGGVRIEDDAVVEPGGARLLTAAPRDPAGGAA